MIGVVMSGTRGGPKGLTGFVHTWAFASALLDPVTATYLLDRLAADPDTEAASRHIAPLRQPHPDVSTPQPDRNAMPFLNPEFLDDPLLTPKEAARILGVGVATLAVWVREERLPCVLTPGGHRRYQRSVVHALLNDSDTSLPEEQQRQEDDVLNLY